jgi:precorrin-6A/cobalt-precorrin-6A reductase
MQGPFTQKFNEALWEQLKIDVVITKESGSIGGTEEKVQACLNLKIPVIILERPEARGIDASALKFTETTSGGGLNRCKTNFEDFVRKVEGNP